VSPAFTESDVEDAALAWLVGAGWQIAHGPDIAPDMPASERATYAEVVLARRLRDALARLNPELPAVDVCFLMDLFFDLDGTLTDPASGITRCLHHALLALGRQAPSPERLRRYIGPPLRGTFVELLATDDRAVIEAAIVHYRERFSAVGLYQNEVYPDVPEGLTALSEAGHRLWVVTSKPEVYACRILEHFDLTSRFQRIYGSELSGKNNDKIELIAHVLECERLDAARVWMIGDRAEDIVGGRANGTGTIGVSWGFGSEEELIKVEPDIVVDSMSKLSAFVEAAQRQAVEESS
jgi:phosphoglycolate phosphatase